MCEITDLTSLNFLVERIVLHLSKSTVIFIDVKQEQKLKILPCPGALCCIGSIKTIKS